MLFETDVRPTPAGNRTAMQPSQQTPYTATPQACNCNRDNTSVRALQSTPVVKPLRAPATQPLRAPISHTSPQPPVSRMETFLKSTGQPDRLQQAATAATPVNATCPVCGSRSGCDALPGFSFDAAELNITHKNQIRELAKKIIDLGISAVIATGHADTTDAENHRANLGYRRAQNVVSAVMNRMHKIKPYAAQNVFWKVRTKGASLPISKSDAAMNRRVEVCLQ